MGDPHTFLYISFFVCHSILKNNEYKNYDCKNGHTTSSKYPNMVHTKMFRMESMYVLAYLATFLQIADAKVVLKRKCALSGFQGFETFFWAHGSLTFDSTCKHTQIFLLE